MDKLKNPFADRFFFFFIFGESLSDDNNLPAKILYGFFTKCDYHYTDPAGTFSGKAVFGVSYLIADRFYCSVPFAFYCFLCGVPFGADFCGVRLAIHGRV